MYKILTHQFPNVALSGHCPTCIRFRFLAEISLSSALSHDMTGSSGGWSYIVMNIRRPLYNLGTAPPSKGKEGSINKGEEASGAVPRLY